MCAPKNAIRLYGALHRELSQFLSNLYYLTSVLN